MVARVLADVIVLVHFAFVVFVPLGGFVAWRWRSVRWSHVASVVYSAGIVAIGWSCPLTLLERRLLAAGGEVVSGEGFMARYVEGVLYPAHLTPLVRSLVAVAVVVSWVGLQRRTRRQHLQAA